MKISKKARLCKINATDTYSVFILKGEKLIVNFISLIIEFKRSLPDKTFVLTGLSLACVDVYPPTTA